MNDLLICLNAIVPVFLVIAVGWLAKRFGVIKESEVSRFNAITFRVFMLLMCFYNVYSSDLESAVRPRLTAYAVAGVAVMYLCSWLYAHFFVKERRCRGVVIQGLYRSNYLILGLPIVSGLAGDVDLGAVSLLGAIIVLRGLLTFLIHWEIKTEEQRSREQRLKEQPEEQKLQDPDSE